MIPSSEQVNAPEGMCLGIFCPANKTEVESEEGSITLQSINDRCVDFAGCIVLRDAELAARGVK